MSLRRVAWAYGTSLFGLVTALLTNLWLLRAVAAEVSKDELGLFVACSTVLGYALLLQIGLDLVACQRIAEALARGREDDARRYYGQITRFNRWLGGLFIGLTVGGVAYLAAYPPTGRFDPALLPTLVGLIGGTLCVGVFSSPYSTALGGAQQLHTVNGLRLVGNFVTVFLAFGLLKGGAGILSLPIAQAGVAVGQVAVLARLRRVYCPWADLPAADPWVGFGGMLRMSLAMCGVFALNTVEIGCEPVVFKAVLDDPLSALATYNMWQRFPSLVVALAAGLVGNSGPTLAAAFAADRGAGVLLFRKLFALSAGLGVAGAVGVGLWLTPFVRYWLHGEYDLPDGPAVATAIAATVLFRVVVFGMASSQYPLNATRLVVVGSGVVAATKVGVGAALSPPSPVFGMSAAWACGGAVAFAWYAVVLHRQRVLSLSHSAALAAVCGATVAGVWGAAPHTAGCGVGAMALGMAATVGVGGGVLLVTAGWTGSIPRRWYRRPLDPLSASGERP